MRLISLTANKDTFKPVYFTKETGINLIVATQKNPHKSDKGDTTNGVGKSLLIAIIHFCLGSSKKDGFKNQLPGWEFILKFKIDNKEYTSRRSTDNQGEIVLNGEKLILKFFNKRLGDLLFDIPEDVSELSFRSILPFFIRPNKASYVDAKDPNAVKKPFQIQMINALLLGLDLSLAEEKKNITQEKDRIRDLVKNLREDAFLKDFFAGKKDISLTKQELHESIVNLEENLKSFKIADNYYEIKEHADRIKHSIEGLQNEIALVEIQIKNIDESLKISPDIKRENIERIYKEASVILKENTLKQLYELEEFYAHISRNRGKRLLEQKNSLIRHLDILITKKADGCKNLDEKMNYLNAHHALDVYTKLSNKLSDLKSKHDNVLQYEELFEKYKQETRNIKEKNLKASERTDEYLRDAKEIVLQTNDFFRSLVKRFYPRSNAGITVYNNEGENQIRYTIEPKIEADKSDGIGNVKLFAYDFTILLKGFGHKIDFLFHDSRLLDGIDPRQKHELFLILNEFVQKFQKQYILTVNYNQLEEIKGLFNPEEYKSIIQENTILELKDSSPSEKLLGIQIDLDYD
ncbi:DUF2326 domain-containing protein [Acetobacteroides hydrogenigenes]|uniref:Uncharacterized protein YydD (DUF2326 family) n=1 Tax=Acetobacteroides hydrogenigenes TaxID=979970 RepID=A0A4R2E604_9BACT|nr:DUF2326 domain-containing protein [Acetobacteroides hydrogenigenes]TCN63035.1 uncharacterized protein YydD (DUF2326 family) [Acetobacteroides hydrogenigenes]